MKRSELITRARFVSEGSKRILRLDFSNLAVADIQEVVTYATGLIAHMPDKSVLTLTDVSGTGFDSAVIESLKEFTKHNKRHVIAGGVLGVSGLKKVVFQTITNLSGRSNLKAFDSEAEAIAWLTAYSG